MLHLIILQVQADSRVLAWIDGCYEFDGCGFLEPVVFTRYTGQHFPYHLQLTGPWQYWLAGEVTPKDGMRCVEAERCAVGFDVVDGIKVVQQHHTPGFGGGGGVPPLGGGGMPFGGVPPFGGGGMPFGGVPPFGGGGMPFGGAPFGGGGGVPCGGGFLNFGRWTFERSSLGCGGGGPGGGGGTCAFTAIMVPERQKTKNKIFIRLHFIRRRRAGKPYDGYQDNDYR